MSKPTKAQLSVLRKLADGANLSWVHGIRSNDAAWLRTNGNNTHTRIRVDYIYKFREQKWIAMSSDPAWAWRNATYKITEEGLAVVRKSEHSGEARG